MENFKNTQAPILFYSFFFFFFLEIEKRVYQKIRSFTYFYVFFTTPLFPYPEKKKKKEESGKRKVYENVVSINSKVR